MSCRSFGISGAVIGLFYFLRTTMAEESNHKHVSIMRAWPVVSLVDQGLNYLVVLVSLSVLELCFEMLLKKEWRSESVAGVVRPLE
jgi:hypothetical protein